ncbi:hypothetical protein H4Q26_005328 [Puccinia striiformis f. sp. tritici PST-130]|nr:hypothetical protein H4Q26_005328 [Puccinia striiformis f. sp. tritici PST-130]
MLTTPHGPAAKASCLVGPNPSTPQVPHRHHSHTNLIGWYLSDNTIHQPQDTFSSSSVLQSGLLELSTSIRWHISVDILPRNHRAHLRPTRTVTSMRIIVHSSLIIFVIGFMAMITQVQGVPSLGDAWKKIIDTTLFPRDFVVYKQTDTEKEPFKAPIVIGGALYLKFYPHGNSWRVESFKSKAVTFKVGKSAEGGFSFAAIIHRGSIITLPKEFSRHDELSVSVVGIGKSPLIFPLIE